MKKSLKKFSFFIFTAVLFFQIINSALGFSDVPANYKYAPDIQHMEQIGAVQEDLFKAEELITREVFAKWILINAGFTNQNYEPQTKRRFKDVKKINDPYAPYIYKLVDLGVINLTSNSAKFLPENSINRKNALLWMFQVEGIPVPKVFPKEEFQATDLSINSKNAAVIHKAIQLGILDPGKTSPYRKLKRGEAAHYLRTIKNLQPTLTVTIVPTLESDMVSNPKFDVMVGAWNRIFQTYLKRGNVSKEDLIYGAIEGMVKELDDKHSNFERPGDNALLESLSGEIQGIGAVIQMKDEEVVIVSPISGSPADKAGLLPDDVITKVDEKPVKGLTLSAVANLIKGPKGTQVKLSIKRGGKELTYTVTRDVIRIVSAEMERTDDNIAKINITTFGENTIREFNGIIADLRENKPKGIVINLRNNPGGFLITALKITGFYVKSDDKITSVRYTDRTEHHLSTGTGELSGIKTVVIVNKGSASASEIFAGALQDYGLAKIIGEKTYGKGTVQELSDFSDGSTLKLTVAEWLTPNGNLIEGNGITPDIIVPLTDEDRKADRDPQMEAALAELRK